MPLSRTRAPSTPEVDPALVGQEPIRLRDGVVVYAKIHGEMAHRRRRIAGLELAGVEQRA